MTVYILFRTFGLHVWSWFSCPPLLTFEIYIQVEGISYRNEDFNKAFLSSFIYHFYIEVNVETAILLTSCPFL